MVDFDVTPLGETDHVDVGDRAPDFTRPLVTDEFWENASLSELTDEGPLLLVFYTMDGAFPSTYMWNEFRDRSLSDSLPLVGVSISTPYEHATFLEDRGVDARLFSDPANTVAREYGIDHELDGMVGISEPRPSVFLLDPDRTVAYAWVAQEWPEFPDYDELEAEIDGLV
ncbi:MAG: redoxin domain-containing protein [Halobacteriota archaeon]